MIGERCQGALAVYMDTLLCSQHSELIFRAFLQSAHPCPCLSQREAHADDWLFMHHSCCSETISHSVVIGFQNTQNVRSPRPSHIPWNHWIFNACHLSGWPKTERLKSVFTVTQMLCLKSRGIVKTTRIKKKFWGFPPLKKKQASECF